MPSGVRNPHPGVEGLVFLTSPPREGSSGRVGPATSGRVFYVRAGLQVGPGASALPSVALGTRHAVVCLLFCRSPKVETV